MLGQVPYQPTYAAMQDFNAARSAETPDRLWICEHPPVFTLGLAGRAEHLLATGDIAVVATNRGGQVTYHGPGQVVAYPLLDLKRRGYFVKEYVYRLEEAVIRTLLAFGITGHRVARAPGIYVRLEDPRSHAVLEQRPKRSKLPFREKSHPAKGHKPILHKAPHPTSQVWAKSPPSASKLVAIAPTTVSH